MNEQVLQFGEQGRLVGILASDGATQGAPLGVIIPNTGVDHRVGPNRLHVHLSRALAESGIPVLRMDLTGMGDSLTAPSGAASDSVRDMRDALDLMESRNIAARYAVVGICSGGHDAHHLAVSDKRISAAAFVDHYTYPTAQFKRNFWKERLTDPRRAGNFARRMFSSKKGDKASFRSDQVEIFEQPDADTFQAHVEQFIARQMNLFFLYTGEIQNLYNYSDQLFDAFPVLAQYPGAVCHYEPKADHTFSRINMRVQLIELLLNWLASFKDIAAARPS